MSTSIIILAAGKGTRLKSNKPKVFHEVGNLPIIFHVIETAKKLKPKEIVVVISQSMLQYKAQILNYDVKIKICIQDEQKGTGHAVKCCENLISQKTQNTLILYADSPLISSNSLKRLSKNIFLKKAELCIMAMKTRMQNRYGKIILDKNQNLEIKFGLK